MLPGGGALPTEVDLGAPPCHDEIDIPGEPPDVNETKKRGRTDDRNISREGLGNLVQLGEIPQLGLGQHSGLQRQFWLKFRSGFVRARIIAVQEFSVDQLWWREHIMIALLPKHNFSKCSQQRHWTLTVW